MQAGNMRVDLTWSEVMQAAIAGAMRQVCNMRDKRRNAQTLPGEHDSWGIHIEGCCGELAVAKCLNLFWTGSHGKLGLPDVGRGLQVRLALRDHYSLIIRDTDDDNALVVLVVGRAPSYRVVGWYRCGDGKRREWWKIAVVGRDPAYFVPQSELRPMQELLQCPDFTERQATAC
jgi:hypothetical protein